MIARLLIGDVRAQLATLDDGSVDCVITSPPYPWQRAYLPDGHPDKPLEVGQEANPGEALESLLDIMDLLWVVLADHGTYWINLGDAHSGSGGSGGDYDEGGLREGQARFQGSAKIARNTLADGTRFHSPWKGTQPGWPRAQSVCWIPQLFGASLAYGRNLLTGAEHQQWITRPPVVWAKPNPTVGATGRKFRTATEYIVYGGKRTDHYFDLDAVRILCDDLKPHRGNRGGHKRRPIPGQPAQTLNPVDENGYRVQANPAGRPPYNWWLIESPAQFPGAHFAVMPEGIITDPVKVGSPERVCKVCSGPVVRVTQVPGLGDPDDRTRLKDTGRLSHVDNPPEKGWEREHLTTGWACPCGPTLARPGDHPNSRPGLILDPFCGTGTVGQVAVGHGRDALLIDLDGRNRALVEQRLGMFLEVAG